MGENVVNKEKALAVTHEEFYHYVASIGGDYGERFRLLKSATLEAGIAKCVLRAPDNTPAAESIFLDALISTAHVFGMVPGMRGSSMPLALPAGVGDFDLNLASADTYYVETRAKGRKCNVETFDIVAFTPDGTSVASLTDVQFSRIALTKHDQRNQVAASLIHKVCWQELPLSETSLSLSGCIYVTSTDEALARDWCAKLNEAGCCDAHPLVLDAAEGVHVDHAHAATTFLFVAPEANDWLGQDRWLPLTASATLVDWHRYINEVCCQSSALVLTSNAQYCGDDAPLPDPVGAACWAAAGSLFNSATGGRLHVIDMHGIPATSGKVKVLTNAVPAQEPMMLYKQGQFYKPCIQRLPLNPGTEKSTALFEQAQAVVTGSSGALAQHVMEWCAQQGMSQITGISRTICEPTSFLPNRILMQQKQGDIAEAKQWSTALESGKAFIFHLAGANPDIAELSPLQQAECAFQGKYFGLLSLGDLLTGAESVHLVLFSSVAAIIGSADQVFYSAANAAAVAAAIRLTHETAHGLSVIQFGPWQGSGMASDERLSKIIQAKGLDYIAPWDALRAMHMAITAPEPVLTIAQFNDHYILDVLNADNETTQKDQYPKEQLEAFLLMTESEQLQRVMDEITVQAAESLEVAVVDVDVNANLFDLGFDSLMALEMRNALSQKYDVKINLHVLMGAGTLKELAQASLPIIQAASGGKALSAAHSAPDSSLVL